MKRIILVVISLIGVLSIIASGGGGGGGGGGTTDTSNTISYDGDVLTFDLDLPPTLAEPPIAGLEVYVTLNGGAQNPLVVDITNKVITGQISGIAPGSYQLQVVYFDEIGGIDTTLATYTTSITLVAGQTLHITIADADLDKNIDDDGDGYTNLAELRINTDPHNIYSTPATLTIFAIGNGSYGESSSASHTMKSTAGEALTGTSSSINYQVTAGFTSY